MNDTSLKSLRLSLLIFEIKALVVLFIALRSSDEILLGTSALSVAVAAPASAFVAISMTPATVSEAAEAVGTASAPQVLVPLS